MKMAEQIGDLDAVITNLGEVKDDIAVPRNVRTKIDSIIGTLRADIELSIRINKTLNDLDEISNDVNLQPYTRTQIWSAISLLEKI